jgi:hypothetical protein
MAEQDVTTSAGFFAHRCDIAMRGRAVVLGGSQSAVPVSYGNLDWLDR